MSQSLQDELFEAEQIIDDKLVEEPDGTIVQKWKVKWRGYDNEDNTLEPKTHLQHLEIWQEYEQNKLNNTNCICHSHSNTNKNTNKQLSLIQQIHQLSIINNSMNILNTNTSNDLLFTHQQFNNISNIKKIEKLIKTSEKKIITKLPKFTPQ
eukprot:425288_1